MRRKNITNRDSGFQTTPGDGFCLFPDQMVAGNQARLLVDGQRAFPSMLAAIESACHFVLLDSYIFNADNIGTRFAESLCQKAKEGVKVFVVVDGVGTIGVATEFFEGMRRMGVSVLVYRPVAPWRRGWGILRRNHRKLLVVDGVVGFVGGLNIGDEWLPADQGGYGWHDIHAQVNGPVVRDLAKLSLATWTNMGQTYMDPNEFLPLVDPAGDTLVAIVGSRERKPQKAIRSAYLHAIKRAQKYIFIANAYFIPGRGFRRALRNAVLRGVDVRVMVPGRGDILPVQMASQALFSRLMKSGIKLFLWNDALLHAKTAVIDDAWSTVGSFNLDRRSWAMNLEVNVNVLGEEFATRLREVFEEDQKKCHALDREIWSRRPWLQRLLERFFYLFRKLM